MLYVQIDLAHQSTHPCATMGINRDFKAVRSTVRQLALSPRDVQMEHLVRLTLLFLLISFFLASTGCSSMNYRRIAYETLRQVDCKVNELDDYCERTFANDFHEYERLREDYLNNKTVKESWLSRGPK